MFSFGLRLPADKGFTPIMGWGARAIYGPNDYLDLLPDRQSFIGPDTPDPLLESNFIYWVNKAALPLLRNWMKKDCSGSSSYQMFEIHSVASEDHLYTMLASPQGSYGYMYVGAFVLPLEQKQAFLDHVAELRGSADAAEKNRYGKR